MWCINCGTKLPNNAKFCFNCGTNLAEILKEHLEEENDNEVINSEKTIVTEIIEEQDHEFSTLETGEEVDSYEIEEEFNGYEKNEDFNVCDKDSHYANDKSIIELKEDINLRLGNRTIKLPYLARQYVYLENKFNRCAELCREIFLESYNTNYTNLEGMIIYSLENCSTWYESALLQVVNFSNLFKYTHLDDAIIPYLNDNNFSFLIEMEKLAEKYDEIMTKVAQDEYTKAMKKASRGVWQGGGFGISGAIKGAITAKAMNVVTDSVCSIFDNMGTMSKSKAEYEFNRIYKDKSIIDKLADKIYLDIINIKYSAIEALSNTYGIEIPDLYNNDDCEEALKLNCELFDGKYKGEIAEEKILDMLIKYPFEIELYITALSFNSNIEGIKEYADFFNISLVGLDKKAEEVRVYREKLESRLGEAMYKFESLLSDNVFYNELKFEYTKDLIKNIEIAFEICDVSRLEFIYREINETTKEKFYEAFDNYAAYNNEVPILFFEEATKGYKSEGFILTNRNIYFNNRNYQTKCIKLEDIKIIFVEGNKLIINDEKLSAYMINSSEREVLVHFLEYVITIIKYSELSGIKNGSSIPDKLKLRDNYYGGGSQLNDNFGQAKEFLENKLAKSTLYHNLKSKMNGNLAFDINLILKNKKWDRVWYIYNTIEDSVNTKLQNAIISYAQINGETPFLIYDGTAFGSGKDGIVITDEAIYGKAFMCSFSRIAYCDINSFEMFEDKFIVNGTQFDFGMIDSSQRKNFSQTLFVVINRLIAEKYCPDAIKVKVENKLKLNSFYNYNITEQCEFEVDKSISLKENIVKLINIYGNNQLKENTFIVGENAEAQKRFNGALTVYKISPLPDEILLYLYDNTVLGSGKEGFILSNKSIIYKNIFSKSKRILLSEIDTIELKGSNIKIGSHEIFINMIPKPLLNDFKELLSNMVNVIKSIQES